MMSQALRINTVPSTNESSLGRRIDRSTNILNLPSWHFSRLINLAWLIVSLFVIGFIDSPKVSAQVQDSAETRAFRRAMDAFKDGLFDRAEREFSRFITTYPQSGLLAEATLLQAQSALNQTNASRAITIITAGMAKAGILQDQFRYCLGNAYLESGNLTAAADTFAAIPRALTNSSLLLEASHGEALARFRLGNFPAVIQLLQDSNGTFQRASRTRPNDDITVRGKMLLAEAHFRQREFREAETALESLPTEPLLPEIRWERQYLTCRLKIAKGELTNALADTTNLLSYATAAGTRTLVADSYSFQADLLRRMNRPDEAMAAYTNNLVETAPPTHRRLALLNIIEVLLTQNQTREAATMLESFLIRRPEDAASDIIQLTRGELELKLYLSENRTNTSVASGTGAFPTIPPPPEVAVGPLQAAQQRFDDLLTTNTTSALRGKAYLDKGWCLWLGGKYSESVTAFRGAIQALPQSEDLAIAHFKLGDAYFMLKDFTNALSQYRTLTNDFATTPSVRRSLFSQALYQMLHVCIAIQDETGASETLRALLNGYADTSLADRSLFLISQELLRRSRPDDARQRLQEFLDRFPQSSLRPEVELAMAQTFQQSRDWNKAIASYDQWLQRYPTNALAGQAEFNRAWVYSWSGDKTNALRLFTQFVSDHPNDIRRAPKAQYWIGEYLQESGQYRDAISNFQKILENTNWPITTLTYQARFMAGVAAFSAQLWMDAAGPKGHFNILINDDDCPPDIRAKAWFAYGDATLNLDQPQSQPILKYRDAKNIFSRIPQFYTNSPLVPAAWGKIAECYFQMASQDPQQYAEATNAYLRVMNSATADISLRSQAEFGLAKALEHYGTNYGSTLTPIEASGLQKAAFDHYYTITIGGNLRDGEFPDPLWLERAGSEAARIAISLKQWALAITIYKRMQEALPPIRARLEDRISSVQERSGR